MDAKFERKALRRKWRIYWERVGTPQNKLKYTEIFR
jgi:hypothetical protein